MEDQEQTDAAVDERFANLGRLFEEMHMAVQSPSNFCAWADGREYLGEAGLREFMDAHPDLVERLT